MEVLGERGYKYDCSTFPTYLGPLARAYYFMKSGEMTEEEKEKRKGLFGKFSDGFRTLKPHFVKAAGRDLLEIPVTTLPLFKTPIHASYVIYLATFSKIAARTYWRNALRLCKLSGTQPSLLLHPLDFLGAEDAPELAFFPGMNMPVAAKLEIMDDIIRSFAERFNLVNMNGHADHVLENTNN